MTVYNENVSCHPDLNHLRKVAQQSCLQSYFPLRQVAADEANGVICIFLCLCYWYVWQVIMVWSCWQKLSVFYVMIQIFTLFYWQHKLSFYSICSTSWNKTHTASSASHCGAIVRRIVAHTTWNDALYFVHQRQEACGLEEALKWTDQLVSHIISRQHMIVQCFKFGWSFE